MSEIHEPLSVHEEVIACLHVYREAWLPLRDTAARAGGNNAQSNLAANEAMGKIDGLLDILGALVINNSLAEQ